MTAISLELAQSFGMNEEEYNLACEIMQKHEGRDPNLVELSIFSVMWSEHCSYKSSKYWLKTLPTTGECVIQGPGENAGVIDIGDNQAAVFKIESHNHPSFIEPFQGAATGVGGIMRDVFTMGARPVANLNALRFGEPDHPKTRHLITGVVAGIGGYGNCMGIPTVGGECEFDKAYNGNILVNAMTVGVADADKIFYAKAAGVGNPIVYVGAKTGRDGIHGATMASAEFSEDSEEKRPTVQVGDPFTEKLLLEACLELMATDAVIAIQDMGAAGLTSSSVEMASKGEVGVALNLDLVPLREENMAAEEIMLSESQERMLMVLKPGREEEAQAIFTKWELDFAVIGKVTDTNHLELHRFGKKVANMPVPPLVDKAPEYQRDYKIPSPPPVIPTEAEISHDDIQNVLNKLLSHPNIASKSWIAEQYDSMVGNNTIRGSGGDAALVRVHDTQKALAMCTDCTPRYCYADPIEGGKQAVAEAWRNIITTGATPLACTNNLNFGNPEKKEIMGQIVGCIKGMAEACEILEFPIVSGNVSLYNETEGQAILPTPVIGGVGLIKDYKKAAPNKLTPQNIGQELVLIGQRTVEGWLGQSLYSQLILNTKETYAPPPVNLPVEKRTGLFVKEQILAGTIKACHDVSTGGLLVHLIKFANLLSSRAAPRDISTTVGMKLDMNDNDSYLFGEDQGLYIIATNDADQLILEAGITAVDAVRIGRVTEKDFILNDTTLEITNQQTFFDTL